MFGMQISFGLDQMKRFSRPGAGPLMLGTLFEYMTIYII